MLVKRATDHKASQSHEGMRLYVKILKLLWYWRSLVYFQWDWQLLNPYSGPWEPSKMYYNDVTMGANASQITSLTIAYSTVYSSALQRKHQRSASLAFVLGIHRWPANSPHKGPVTRKMFPSDDSIMIGDLAQPPFTSEHRWVIKSHRKSGMWLFKCWFHINCVTKRRPWWLPRLLIKVVHSILL